MHQIARYSFNKLIVLWTVLLLFTPCTTKQSIKGFLGIPVTTLYTVDQANKLRSCPEIRQGSEDQATSYTTQQQLKNLRPDWHRTSPGIDAEPVTASLIKLQEQHEIYTVPIYILHDQLLI